MAFFKAHHIKGPYESIGLISDAVNLDHLAKVVFARVPHYKGTSFSLSIAVSFGSTSLSITHP